jgi:hypothetical protein
MDWSERERDDVARAAALLGSPSLAIRLADLIGSPVEGLIKRLPEGAARKIDDAVKTALGTALDAALATLDPRAKWLPAREHWHKAGAAAAGAAGGAFGLAGMAIELPVSTLLILRAIADIARSEGEDLAAPEARLACFEVFALGGRSSGDDAAETGYYAVRAALAEAVSQAAQYVAQNAVSGAGAPVLVQLIAKVAERFGVIVTKKIAAQLVPAIGAAGGALVNALFIDHFQTVARGHFVLRRLERKFGRAAVEAAFKSLS